MPAGGRGALYFWGGLSLLLACGLVGAYQQAASSEKKSRQLSEQSVLLINERDKLRSQVDMLQTELSQQGVQLKNSEETLREAKQTLQSAQAQNDQQGQQAEAARRAEGDLQALLQKAVPAADGLEILNGKAGDGVVTVRLSNTLLFDAGDVAPNAKGADILKKLAAALKGAASVQEIAVGAIPIPPWRPRRESRRPTSGTSRPAAPPPWRGGWPKGASPRCRFRRRASARPARLFPTTARTRRRTAGSTS